MKKIGLILGIILTLYSMYNFWVIDSVFENMDSQIESIWVGLR